MTEKGVWRRSGLRPEKRKAGKKRMSDSVSVLLVFSFAVFVGLVLGYLVPPLGIWTGRP